MLDEFNWESSVSAGHTGVTVSAGVVTWSGHVDSYANKFAAEAAARRVKGGEITSQDELTAARGVTRTLLKHAAWSSLVSH